MRRLLPTLLVLGACGPDVLDVEIANVEHEIAEARLELRVEIALGRERGGAAGALGDRIGTLERKLARLKALR